MKKYECGLAGKIGERRKLEEFRDWDISSSENKFAVLVMETFCTISKETKRFLKNIVKKNSDDENESSLLIKQLFERLSIMMHNIRIHGYSRIYSLHSS